MSNSWVIALGFDLDAVSHTLQWGVATATGTPGFLSDIDAGDTVGFTLWNLNVAPVSSRPKDFSVTSASALTTQSIGNVFGTTNTPNRHPFDPNIIKSGGTSPVFPTATQAWSVVNAPDATSLLTGFINHIGQFAMTFHVKVDEVGFGVDPVMIVTSGS